MALCLVNMVLAVKSAGKVRYVPLQTSLDVAEVLGLVAINNDCDNTC